MSAPPTHTCNELAIPSISRGEIRGYRPELDAVRFLAFFLVFILHILTPTSVLYRNLSPRAEASYGHEWSIVITTVSLGLCLFFTLSAYLITDLLLEEKRRRAVVSVSRFYVRRVLRIWPLYLLGIGIGIGIAAAQRRWTDVHGFVWYLFCAGNVYCGLFGWPESPMAPLWSISVEEQFYLVWPWAMRTFTKRGLIGCAMAFVIAANTALMILSPRHPVSDYTIWVNSFVQFEMFAAGILLVILKKNPERANPIAGAGLVAAGLAVWIATITVFEFERPPAGGNAESRAILMLGFAAIATGSAVILHGFRVIGSAAIPRAVAYLGKISFGLYVFHVLTIDFARVILLPLHGVTYLFSTALVAFVVAVAVSVISYAYLESPFLRLKRKFEYLHSRPI